MLLIWIGFIVLILGLLALDLGVLNRKAHVVSIGEAFGWTAFWISLALLFNAGIFFAYENHWLGIGVQVGHELTGRQAALQFFTGYVIEKSLSLDNIFVIAMIFSYFAVPAQYQHRLLFWGITGAIVMRGIMIGAGVALIEQFSWMVYVFGGLLLVTAVRMMITRHDNLNPDNNPIVRIIRKRVRITSDFRGSRFFVREGGRLSATPLLLALVVVESADIIFAIDSIPAVIAITRDPFIVFTSNVFAILGLRSLYFALAAAMSRFRFLKFSLVFVLVFVGVKMILSHHHPIPTVVSLSIIAGILGVGVAGSLIGGKKDTAPLVSPLEDEIEHLASLTYHNARRVVILVVGATLIIAGTAMLLLPGPGILTVVAGIAVLATEFIWARIWLKTAKDHLLLIKEKFHSQPEDVKQKEK